MQNVEQILRRQHVGLEANRHTVAQSGANKEKNTSVQVENVSSLSLICTAQL